MTRSNLISRIQEGGGEGWHILQDEADSALWFCSIGEAVAVIFREDFDCEFPEDRVQTGIVAVDAANVEQVRIDDRINAVVERGDAVLFNYSDGFNRPNKDALDAMRTLSQLDRRVVE